MQMSVNSFSVMSIGVSGWGKGAGDDMRVAPDEEETRERDLRVRSRDTWQQYR